MFSEKRKFSSYDVIIFVNKNVTIIAIIIIFLVDKLKYAADVYCKRWRIEIADNKTIKQIHDNKKYKLKSK